MLKPRKPFIKPCSKLWYRETCDIKSNYTMIRFDVISPSVICTIAYYKVLEFGKTADDWNYLQVGIMVLR